MQNDEINLLEGVLNTTTPKMDATKKDSQAPEKSDFIEKQDASVKKGIEAEASTAPRTEDREDEAEANNVLIPVKTHLVKYSPIIAQDRKRELLNIHFSQSLHAANRTGQLQRPADPRRLQVALRQTEGRKPQPLGSSP